MPLPLEPLSSTHPSRLLSSRAWLELPESYSKFPLAVYFTHGGVHVLTLTKSARKISVLAALVEQMTLSQGIHGSGWEEKGPQT